MSEVPEGRPTTHRGVRDTIESPFNSLQGNEVRWQPGFSTVPK